MFKPYHLFTFAILILGITYFSQVQSAVIGLDLGSEFLKVSSIAPGKSFYIVEDTTTKRKTPTAIAFYNGERIYEYDTIVKRPRAYQTTFMGLPKFLGKKFDDAKVKQVSQEYLEDYLIEENERGTVSFKLKNFKMADDEEGTSYSLKVEELLGMIFRHIKSLAQKQTERQLRDIAVAIPPFWNFRERYALHDALTLADLNPLSFMSENTAAALYYALERQDNQTHTVIFYNIGSTSLKVSLVEFYLQTSNEKQDKGASFETVKVLAEAWDENIGGLVFDINLAKHLANEFDTKPARAGKKGLLTSNPARAKLLKEVNRLKEILSANKQSQIYIENIFESTDLKAMIDRNVLDQANKELWARLTKPIDDLLAKAGKTIKDIDAFELIGGGIRIPKIQQVLSEHLEGKEVSTHLNGDESMTLGAAFHAANLSASFKTRQIYVNDGYNFDIRVELKDLVQEDQSPIEGQVALDKKAVLFPYKTRYGSKKILSFEHDGDVNATFYAQPSGADAEELVISYGVTGFRDAITSSKYKDKDLGKPKVQLHFRLNYLGLIELNKAEVTIDEIILYEDKSTNKTASDSKSDANAKSDAKSDSKTDKVEAEDANDETGDAGTASETEGAAEPASETADSTSEPNEEPATEGAADSTTEQSEKKLKKKTITHHIPLKIETYIPGTGPMTEEQLEQSRDLLSKFDQNEEKKRRLAEAKNRLEAYLYSTRDLLEEIPFVESSQESEREELKTMLTEHDEWLYSEEASKSNHLPFNKRYEDMQKIVSRIQNRLEQRLRRPEAVTKAREYLATLNSKIEEVMTAKPWITEEAKNKVVKQIEDASTWLDETIESQDKLLHHEDPVLTVSGIVAKLDKLKDAFGRLKSTLKPKAPKNGTAGSDSEPYSFKTGKDGKFDEAAFREYMEKMNITFDDLKAAKADKDDDDTQIPGDETVEPEDQKTQEEPQETPEEPAAAEKTAEPKASKKEKKLEDIDL